MTTTLQGKTLLIPGASCGSGLANALRAARDGIVPDNDRTAPVDGFLRFLLGRFRPAR